MGTPSDDGTVKISSELGTGDGERHAVDEMNFLFLMLDVGVELRLISCGNWLFPFSIA